MLINPIGTLRQLKGAPLSILIALTIVNPRLVSSSWLAGCTGYSHDAISNATWYLKEFGFIDCDSHRTNWRLVGDVQQLPLPMSMLNPDPKNPDAEKPQPNPPTTTTLNSANNLTEGSSSSFNNRDAEKPQPNPPTTTTLNSANNLTEGSSSSFNNRDAEKPQPDSRLSLLRQGGIYEPTATELCELEHASYSYLDAHIKQAKRDGIDTSLLIHRIRKNDPKPIKPIIPGSREDGDRYRLCENCMHHPTRCTCDNEEEEEIIEEDI